MTTCPFCLDCLAARSKRQLMDRSANILRAPQVTLSECPYCQGTEWATTEAMIGVERPVVGRGLQLWLFWAISVAVIGMLVIFAGWMRGVVI